MKKFFFLTGILFLFQTGGAQWVQTSGPPGGWDVTIGSLLPFGNSILAGTDENGMYLSTDRGLSWERVARNIFTAHAFTKSGEYVFAGACGQGVSRSSDNGVSWTAVNNGLPEGPCVLALAVIGENIIAVLPYEVYLSTNQGETWTSVYWHPETYSNSSIAVAGDNLYLGTYGQGVLMSDDIGITWTPVNSGLTDTRVVSLTGSGSAIFAATYENGVFRSINNGVTWTEANVGLPAFRISVLAISGTTIFAGTHGGGVFRSVDNGDSWAEVNNGLSSQLFVFSIAVNGNEVFVGDGSAGVYFTDSAGDNWTANQKLPCSSVEALAVSGATIFAGTVFDGLFRSVDNGITWDRITNGLSGVASFNSFLVNGSDIFAGTSNGVFLSKDNGDSWIETSSGLNDNQVLELGISGTNLFAGTNGGVFLSTDYGGTWTEVNNGLTDDLVFALAVSGSTIFAGTYNDGVFRSNDNGAIWMEVNNGLNSHTVFSLAASGPYIFAGIPFDGLYRSADLGDSWTQLNMEPYGSPVINEIMFSGTSIFAAGSGCYVSKNNGDSWTEVSDGIDAFLGIRSLTQRGSDVFAGTDGGGVYINSSLLTGTIKQESEYKTAWIYPNPATNSIMLEADELMHHARVSIFNIIGQKVLDHEFTDLQSSIDISHLPAGAYYLRYLNGMTSEVGKFIKE